MASQRIISKILSVAGAPTGRRREVVLLALPLLALAGLGFAAWPRTPIPESMELLAISGFAGEWEMTGTLTRTGQSRELAGDLAMKHIGWCSQDGPETKSGRFSVRIARLTSAIDGTVSIDGTHCSYSASLTDAYITELRCPDRRPVPLTLWLR